MPEQLKQFPTVLIILAAFVFPKISAQNQTNNYGKEFRFAFLRNYDNFEKVSFAISFEKTPGKGGDTVHISCGSFNTGSYGIPVRRRDTVIDFLKFGSPNAATFDPSKSILIRSNKPISVYAMNNAPYSTDISSILPTERIPGNPVYYVNTYRGDESLSKANNSLFSVVAIDDSCVIHIMPTADSKNNLIKNQLFTVLLRKGQVYEERALDSQSFAGTRIWNTKGCKRFAVFEGAICSQVEYGNTNCGGCDHLYNQSRPLQYLGTKFTTLPFADMKGGYLYQVVATENNTQLKLNGLPVTTLSQGQTYVMNQLNDISICIEADKPVSVVQLMKSGGCNGHSLNLGNPSLMSILPDEQLTTKAGVIFPNTLNISQNPSFPAEYYIGIVCPAGRMKSIRINGAAIDSASFTQSCNMVAGSVKVNPALSYQISSDYGFLAYMYAYGKDESYATEIGSGFENKVTELRISPEITKVCDSFHTFTFMASSDSLAAYKWNFGDGTTTTGDTAVKTYNKTGRFNLRLNVEYPANKGCMADTFDKQITVNDRPYFTLGKDTTFCHGVFHQLAPLSKPNTTFLWSDNTTSNALTVSSNRTVWLTITDSNQCQYTDTVTIKFINCDTNSITIPNVFTPGRVVAGGFQTDDVNDAFETRFTGFNLLKGRIYNRWGTLVYSFNYPDDPYWNGNVNNEADNPCPDGTYYYIFEFINTDTNLARTYNGVVTLIR